MDGMRDSIIKLLEETFAPRDEVYALWLEGADGLGRADEYSDLDIWMDAADGTETAVLDDCVTALAHLAPLDFIERYDPSPSHFVQCNFHLTGTSPYLLIDLCVQSHSRDRRATAYVREDIAELPRVLFDKAGVITMVDPPPPDRAGLRAVCQGASDCFAQRARVTKYIQRGKYLEALTYFHKFVCDPLVVVLRALYTPRHTEYGYTHISDHLPAGDVARLTQLNQIASLKDIAGNLPLADEMFARAMTELDRILGREEA